MANNGFVLRKSGMFDYREIVREIGKALTLNNHFKVKFADGTNPGSISATTAKFTLEATTLVDPIADTQPWRISFDATQDDIDIFVATPGQLPDDGTVSTNPSWYAIRKSGHLTGLPMSAIGLDGRAYPLFNPTLTKKDIYKIDNAKTISRTRWNPLGTEGADPMSFLLSVTNHGVFITIWVEDADDKGTHFMWANIQRGVNYKTGAVKVDKKAPLWCAYSLNGGGPVSPFDDDTKVTPDPSNYPEFHRVRMTEGTAYPCGILKFTIREADVNRPSDPTSATFAHRDNRPIMLGTQHTAMSEDNKYILTCPNGLHTKRHAYADELDMISYTSADVISEHSVIDVPMYGEAAPRKYMALKANGAFNTAVRMFVLVESEAAGLPAYTG